MPPKQLLADSGSFNPQAVAVLLRAYEDVVDQLGLPVLDQKEKAARLLIRFAKSQTDLDAVKLRNAVADSMLNEAARPTEALPGEGRECAALGEPKDDIAESLVRQA